MSFLQSKSAPHLLGAALLLVLFVLSTLFWMNSRSTFPQLQPGTYIGFFEGVLSEEGRIPLYLELGSDKEEVLVAPLIKGWRPQYIRLLRSQSGGQLSLSSGNMPLVLSHPKASLRFTGSQEESGVCSGVVRDQNSQQQGVWKLFPIRSASIDSRIEPEGYAEWLQNRIAIHSLQTNSQELERSLAEAKVWDNGYQRILASPELLQQLNRNLDVHLEQTLEDKRKLERQLEKESDKQSQQVKLSQELTERGKLVSLAQQISEVEKDWIDSFRRTSLRMISAELQEDLRRAEDIRAIKAAIQIEQEHIRELSREFQRRVQGGR